jgi:hypothetical protein
MSRIRDNCFYYLWVIKGNQLVFASFHLLLAESAVVIYKGAKHEFWRFAASQSFSANVCECVETEISKANTPICCCCSRNFSVLLPQSIAFTD